MTYGARCVLSRLPGTRAKVVLERGKMTVVPIAKDDEQPAEHGKNLARPSSKRTDVIGGDRRRSGS